MSNKVKCNTSAPLHLQLDMTEDLLKPCTHAPIVSAAACCGNTFSDLFPPFFLTGASLAERGRRVGQKHFSSNCFTPARSRRGDDNGDSGDTCSALPPRQRRPLRDRGKKKMKHAPFLFLPRLPPSFHRSTHSSQGWPRRQSGSRPNRSGSPPALCLRLYFVLRRAGVPAR